jgi:predicted dehydrogenase
MIILIVGLGSIAKKHINAILLIEPTAEVYALRSTPNATKFHNVTNVISLKEIESIEFDFAIISNPTSEHKKTLEQLIKLNTPIFIEKPLFSSLNIEEVIDSINTNNISTYVACNLRFLNCIRFVKDQLDLFSNKRINEINVYCGSYLPDWRPNVDYGKTYSAIPKLGGGVHLDLIHELDYIYWFFGKPIEVIRKFKKNSTLHIESCDYANYILEYNRFCVSIVLNYYRRDSKRSLELVFEDETWNVDLLKNEVSCNDKVIYKTEQRINDTYQSQMEYFINRIIANKQTFNSVNDAYEVLNICIEK